MMKNKIIFALGLGLIFQWLSLLLSYKKLPFENIDAPIATGGFPFKTFDYPVPPMGSDWPPTEAWPMFFLNLIFWVVVGLISTFLLKERITNKKVIISASAIVLSVFGILYIMFLFD